MYFGFGVAPSMFPDKCTITKQAISPVTAKDLVAAAEPCLNPSHKATIEALRQRFGIEIEVPASAPIVNLGHGDQMVVMGVSGLPRLEGRHEYTDQEVQRAKFNFSLWTVAEG